MIVFYVNIDIGDNMYKIGDWSKIKEKLILEDRKIFSKYDKDKLNEYEKRKIIFNYLVNNLSYDYNKLFDIHLSNLDIQINLLSNEEKEDLIISTLENYNINNKENYKLLKYKIYNNSIEKTRNSPQELFDVIDNHCGICNGISQYYKLLLELNDIYSVCVICDNNTPRNHQINLVYNKEKDIYSFDDITSAITGNFVNDRCFDYDLESAQEINQGIRTVGYLLDKRQNNNLTPDSFFDTFGIILRSEVIDLYIGRDKPFYTKYNLEDNNNCRLPNNIVSSKKYNSKGI